MTAPPARPGTRRRGSPPRGRDAGARRTASAAGRRRVPVRQRRRESIARRLRPVVVVGKVVALVARRAWDAVAPFLRIVTPMGRLVLAAGIASAVVGLLLGWQEFVYLAITLAGGLVVAAAFLVGRGSYGVAVELTPRRVTAGQRALGRIETTNTGPRRSTQTRMELPVGEGVAEFMIPSLEPEARHEDLFAVPTERRAVIVAGPAVSVRGDQLGLLRRSLRWTDPIELFVHPVTTRLATSTAGLIRDLEGVVTKTVTSNDISFHALRPYEPGDDRRYVHWRTSARTGRLMVRQFEETRRSQVVLAFLSQRDHYASDDEFELAVSIMASLGVQVLRDGTQVDVISEEHPLRTITPTALLDDSCRLAPSPRRHPSPRDFVRIATLRLPPPSVAIVVCGSRMPDADLRSIERLFGVDCQTVGFRAALGAESTLAILSRLRLATIGALPELPRIVGRMS